jgi:hypothetical protein
VVALKDIYGEEADIVGWDSKQGRNLSRL